MVGVSRSSMPPCLHSDNGMLILSVLGYVWTARKRLSWNRAAVFSQTEINNNLSSSAACRWERGGTGVMSVEARTAQSTVLEFRVRDRAWVVWVGSGGGATLSDVGYSTS